MLVIGIAGPAGTGKDTLAQAISSECHERELRRRILHFATPLKEACMALWGFTHTQVWNTKDAVDPRWGFSPRQAMQAMGTDHARGMHPSPTVTRTRLILEELRESGGVDVVAIPDLRFPDELEMIRELGGVSVWIERPGAPRRYDHESETALLDHVLTFDHRCLNTGDRVGWWSQVAGCVLDLPGGTWERDGRQHPSWFAERCEEWVRLKANRQSTVQVLHGEGE